MLTLADKGGRRVKEILILDDKVGSILIFFVQPLTLKKLVCLVYLEKIGLSVLINFIFKPF